MTGTMKCVVKTAPGPGNLAYLERPIPQIDSREILVRVKAASTGTSGQSGGCPRQWSLVMNFPVKW